MAASEVRIAQSRPGEITGEEVSGDVLDAIFPGSASEKEQTTTQSSPDQGADKVHARRKKPSNIRR